MNKKKMSGFLIPVILTLFILLMTVSPALAGTAKCKILPVNDLDKAKYCPDCGDPTGECLIQPTPGSSGCSCADDICAAWIANDTVCDWDFGVTVCRAVCRDINDMPVCSQVAKSGGAGTLGAVAAVPQFACEFCGVIPVGGCCNINEDCTSRNCRGYKLACQGTYCQKSYVGEFCTIQEDCMEGLCCVDHVCQDIYPCTCIKKGGTCKSPNACFATQGTCDSAKDCPSGYCCCIEETPITTTTTCNGAGQPCSSTAGCCFPLYCGFDFWDWRNECKSRAGGGGSGRWQVYMGLFNFVVIAIVIAIVLLIVIYAALKAKAKKK